MANENRPLTIMAGGCNYRIRRFRPPKVRGWEKVENLRPPQAHNQVVIFRVAASRTAPMIPPNLLIGYPDDLVWSSGVH